MSDRSIARLCKVDHKTVGKIRESLTGEFPSEKERTYKTKHGTLATMNTDNIGKKRNLPVNSKTSASGKKQPREGINYTPGCPGYACEYNVKVQRETWEQLKEYLEQAGTLTLDAAIIRMFEALSDKPPKTDDICVATPSNVHRLHEHQIKAVGKTIAIREPEKAEIMATALAHNVEQAKAIIKAIAIIYPIAVRKVLEEG